MPQKRWILGEGERVRIHLPPGGVCKPSVPQWQHLGRSSAIDDTDRKDFSVRDHLASVSTTTRDLARWHQLAMLKTPKHIRELEQLERASLSPEIAKLLNVIRNDWGFDIYRAVSDAKISLSSAESTRFSQTRRARHRRAHHARGFRALDTATPRSPPKSTSRPIIRTRLPAGGRWIRTAGPTRMRLRSKTPAPLSFA